MAMQEQVRIKQGQRNPKKTKTRNKNGNPRNMRRRTKKKRKWERKQGRKDKKRNRNIHRMYRRLSRTTKPPLRLHRGTEHAVMLAHRSHPTQVGRNGVVFFVVNTELAAPLQNQVCSGSAGMERAPPTAAAMLSESRLVIASDCYNDILSPRKQIEVNCWITHTLHRCAYLRWGRQTLFFRDQEQLLCLMNAI